MGMSSVFVSGDKLLFFIILLIFFDNLLLSSVVIVSCSNSLLYDAEIPAPVDCCSVSGSVVGSCSTSGCLACCSASELVVSILGCFCFNDFAARWISLSQSFSLIRKCRKKFFCVGMRLASTSFLMEFNLSSSFMSSLKK